MAIRSGLAVFFLVTMLQLLVENHAEITEAPTPQPQQTSRSPMHGIAQGHSLKPEECAPRCDQRCSNTQYKKACLTFCNYCCDKYLCVPPGTYGNKEICPCYNNWKTKRGGPKCP